MSGVCIPFADNAPDICVLPNLQEYPPNDRRNPPKHLCSYSIHQAIRQTPGCHEPLRRLPHNPVWTCCPHRCWCAFCTNTHAYVCGQTTGQLHLSDAVWLRSSFQEHVPLWWACFPHGCFAGWERTLSKRLQSGPSLLWIRSTEGNGRIVWRAVLPTRPAAVSPGTATPSWHPAHGRRLTAQGIAWTTAGPVSGIPPHHHSDYTTTEAQVLWTSTPHHTACAQPDSSVPSRANLQAAPKKLPVNTLFQTHQWIAVSCQIFPAEFNIK